MKEKIKNQKGITLIALIITIIILLILAIVSVSMVVHTGLISKTQEGAMKYKEEELKEASYLNSVLDKYYTNQGMGENNQDSNNTTSSVLKEGAKVELDGIDYTILYVNNDRTVEMISNRVMGNLTLGSGDTQAEGNDDFEKAVNSYNNAVRRINEYCESLYKDENGNYKNSNIISVRSVGSNPGNPLNESERGYNAAQYNFNGASVSTGKLEDNNYIDDMTIMNELKVVNTLDNESYWIPSRTNHSRSDKTSFFGYFIRYANGNEINESCIFDMYGRGGSYGYSATYPVRPIVKMSY